MKGAELKFSALKCFRGKFGKEVSIVYIDILRDETYDKILKVADLLIRNFVSQ